MIKKRLGKAANRSFRLLGNALMRRAIARLAGIDDASLAKSGLSRNAVIDFLETPLSTDPHTFFARQRVQADASQEIATARRWSAAMLVRRMSVLHLRILTAGALIGFGAMSACSVTTIEGDTTTTRRDQPARCRLRPDAPPLAPLGMTSQDHRSRSSFHGDGGERELRPHARAGPTDRTA